MSARQAGPIERYLTEHQGQPATIEQIADRTGEDPSHVRAFLTAAWERDWVDYVPGQGWQFPPLDEGTAGH